MRLPAATHGGAEGRVPHRRGRRGARLAMGLCLVGGLYFAVPRAVVAWVGAPRLGDTPSIAAVLARARRALRRLSYVAALPGHGRAARAKQREWGRAVEERVARLRLAGKTGPELPRSLWLLRRKRGERLAIREVCADGGLDLLPELFALDEPHERLGVLAPDWIAPVALATGRSERAVWALERWAASRREPERAPRAARALLVSGAATMASALAEQAIRISSNAAVSRELERVACVASQVAGRGSAADATRRASEPCKTYQAWKYLEAGRPSLAVQLVDSLEGRPDHSGDFYVRLAIYAEENRWDDVLRMWRSTSARTIGDAPSNIFRLFNPIFEAPIPLGALELLRHRIEGRLVRTWAEDRGLLEVLPRVLHVLARRTLLAGEPQRARRLLSRARMMAPSYEAAQVFGLELAELTRESGKASRSPGSDRQASIQGAYRLVLAGRRAEAAKNLSLSSEKDCRGVPQRWRAVCRLLAEDRHPRNRAASAVTNAKTPLELYRMARQLEGGYGRLWRALRYRHLANPDVEVRAWLLLLALLEPSGRLASQLLPAWICSSGALSPWGAMLGLYLWEGAARRAGDLARAQEVAGRRERLARLVRTAGRLWVIWPR